ncbi:MAG: hypothetical protein LBH95_01955 [Oscillospiraceae bacterium]|jgi:hypothetical protein|nr:hypothetical protein [Oscillospiraceae bacterium]
MSKPDLFEKSVIEHIQKKVLDILNVSNEFGKGRIAGSPRAVGDVVQSILEDSFEQCVPAGIISKYEKSFARRAMADFAFYDHNDNYYIVDNKTHHLETAFNMPNLTSVERLARFYEDDKNHFILLNISYIPAGTGLSFMECKFVPIEHLMWDCLTIGALGWGQIQIANANSIDIDRKQTRKQWMLQLCDQLDIFYPREIRKIEERILRFERIREFWINKP